MALFSRTRVTSPVVLLSLATLAACGGVPARAPDANTDKAATDVSIGDLALAQGGINTLGGGANTPTQFSSPGALRAHLVDREHAVKLDGVLKEWPALTGAKTTVKGPPSDAPIFGASVQYDDAKIYVAGEATDDGFVRTARFADGEDHAVFTLAFPTPGGGVVAYDIALFAGKPGESTGVVRFASGPRKGRDVPGAKIVEAPSEHGYTFEASIPWATFPEAHTLRLGLRGVVRYVDAAPGGAVRVVSTGTGDASSPKDLPPLPTEPEQAVIEGLLGPRGVEASTPKHDLFADVTGDGMKERIAVFDQLLTICGPGYRGGNQFFYRDLGAEVVRLEARDLTGRGKEDIVLRLRRSDGGIVRESFQVMSLAGGDEPQTIFGQEISVASGPKKVTNALHVTGSREIEVRTEPAVGWDMATYREPLSGDAESVLFPWGTVKSRVYRYDGKRFAKSSEVTQPGAPSPPGMARTSTEPALRQIEPPTPVVKKGGDLSASLFEQYKKARGVSDVKPRFDLQVQVAEDARPERVMLVGRDIVVFGPGFKGGNQYAYLSLQQFANDADVKELSARDLTGSGTANIVVRGTRRVAAPGSTTPVEMDVIFVYDAQSGAITRVFGIESSREQGKNRVQGMVQFIPSKSGKGFEIDVRPGRAFGWTEKSYPWPQEQPGASAGASGLEPLLLPWGGVPSARYVWSGSQFVKQ